MAKRTVQKTFPSGNEYLLIADKFIYEVSIYKIFKDRVELAGTKLYSSNSKITIKKETIYKKRKKCIFMKSIEWIAAPKSFIEENHLNIIEPCQKLRKRKKA